ncbi:DUF3319 domain-containing protein [Vibrio ulleungensis]|jgi:hypothetical protein|uniref:DUF3319 domain-containing protein n=1 Tax=Vibrio ulleungensis TaxID=2807619 RepID=A0ABS2HF47_9VIBR|nr:DUF3319 domain-containing protein [Vibrio ulleungensis]MBM7035694.1 DUF3319 domain-containing protein [Vibrio ulleungensis]
MTKRVYKGLTLKLAQSSPEIWEVSIKKQTIKGPLQALCKSIDWWQQTAQLVDPKNFASLAKTSETKAGTKEQYNGYLLNNDTGAPGEWYCMFHGKLLKGGKVKIQQFIDANHAKFAR